VGFGGGGENGYSFAARTPVPAQGSAPSSGSIAKGVAGTAGSTATSRAAASAFLSSRSAGSSGSISKGVEGTAASQAFLGGFTDLKAGRYGTAEQKLLRAIEADPRSAAAHYYLGYTYYLLSRREPATSEYARKAAESIAKAFRIDPTFRPSWGKEGAASR
jgi:tetratricopeptide (TPR) repeat protein